MLETTSCYSLRLEKFVFGGWSFPKSETVVYGADILFRKQSGLDEGKCELGHKLVVFGSGSNTH